MTKIQELLQMKDGIARLNQVNDELQTNIAFLEKELSKEKASHNTWYQAHNTLQTQLREVELFIDELPGITPELKENGYTRIPMVIRLALWIAGVRNDKQTG